MSAAAAKSSKRFDYIDIAKAIAIFFVLMGHAVDSDTGTKTLLYAFHMPLFFMLSGMTSKYRESYTLASVRDFAVKKFYAIYIPYFIWGLIYARFSFKHLLFVLYGTRETLIKAESLTSLWFLPVMLLAVFLVEAVHILTVRTGRNKYAVCAVSAVLFAAVGIFAPHYAKFGDPFGIDIAFAAAAFMLLGHLSAVFFNSKAGSGYLGLATGAIVTLVVFLLTLPLNTPETGYVLMANAVYGNGLLFFVTAAAGSLFVVCIAKLLELLKAGRKPLLYIGQNTLGIFIVHKPVIELFRKICTRLGMDYNFLPVCLVISAVTLLIATFVVFLIKRYVPFLFGGAMAERRKHEQNPIA